MIMSSVLSENRDQIEGLLTEESFLDLIRESIMLREQAPANVIMVYPPIANRLDRMARHFQACRVLRIDPDGANGKKVTVRHNRWRSR